ncbi:RAD55 family ATPase [Natrarchaeobius chitinivorans]|uniref:Recombinase RecA n=1 Tax=Natrarchaeobius chitinivorans TaxID=1679083 RepID=A0A3N6NG25_NATCH|nr:RAD55 family ATPase [Natrarchaeobius chitinivorans]RQG97952.1 recombinase RecA [Natrarchaeobius chitinivorans]
MSGHQTTGRTDHHPLRCDHCGYPIPDEPISTDGGRFCSTSCTEATESGSTLSDLEGYKRVPSGVEPIDSLVPNGMPADAFVLVSGEEGTRRSELLTELAWRALERGESIAVVSYANPPTATLERFFENDWNVVPALEDGRVRILDCFTHRLADREGFLEARNEWTEFVSDAAGDAIVDVSDPGDVREVANTLLGTLEDLEMTETGLVVIDSLDELDALVQDQLVHNFLKDVRATVCKARYVPIFAGVSATGNESVPDDEYVVDGIVDLRLADHLEPEARLSQLAVRKLIGARFLPQWITVEYEPARGLIASVPPADTARTPVVDGEPSQYGSRR